MRHVRVTMLIQSEHGAGSSVLGWDWETQLNLEGRGVSVSRGSTIDRPRAAAKRERLNAPEPEGEGQRLRTPAPAAPAPRAAGTPCSADPPCRKRQHDERHAPGRLPRGPAARQRTMPAIGGALDARQKDSPGLTCAGRHEPNGTHSHHTARDATEVPVKGENAEGSFGVCAMS